MKIGKCSGVSAEVFYDEAQWGVAAGICSGCPILLECRKDMAGDPWSYAGGMTPKQRAAWVKAGMLNGNDAPLMDGRRQRRGAITPEQVKEMLEIFDNEVIGSGGIAKRLGLSKSSVQRILRAHGRNRTPEEQLELARKGGAANAGGRRDGNRTREMVRALYAQGHTPARIAEIIGVQRSYVYEIHSKQMRGEA